MNDPPQVMPRPAYLSPREWIAVGLSLLVVAIFLLSPTSFALGKLDTVAYAVCHRLPERSFFFGGQQLPLCARCSGTFLGVSLTLAALMLTGRSRASRLPPPRVVTVLVFFVLLWAFDGINSYLTLYPGAPHLYEPENWLRLTTGMLNGLALGTFVFAILHFAIWRTPSAQPVIKGFGELARLVAVALLIVALVLTEEPYLLYPLALTSTLGVLAMLISVNTVIVLIITRRESTARRWRDATLPLLVALALSLAIVISIGTGRSALTAAYGLLG